MKLILFTILFLTTVISLSAAPEKVKIHGIVKGLGNNEIVLLNSTQKEIAKVNAQNDKF